MPAPQFENTQTPEPLRKVRPIPGFEEYAPEEAFGGGKSGVANARLAEESGAAISEHRSNADRAVAQQLHSGFLGEADKILYDPTNGAMLKHGRDAMAFDDSADPKNPVSRLEELKTKYVGMAKNDNQKMAVETMVDDTMEKYTSTLRHHAFQETLLQDKQSAQQHMDMLVMTAAHDPAHIDNYKDEDGNMVGGYASQIKAAALAGKLDSTKALRDLYTKVAQEMIHDNNPKGAEEFLKSHPVGSNAVDKSLESAKDNKEAEVKANELLKAAGGDASKAASMVAEDDPNKSKILDRITKAEKQREVLEKQTATKAFEGASQKVQDYMKNNPGKPFNGRDVIGGAYDLLGGNDAKLKASMQKAIDAMGNPDRTGDEKLYHSFMADTDGIKSMSRLDFDTKIAPHLVGEQLSNAKRAYDDMHPKSGSKKDMLASADMRQRLKDALQAGGFYGSDKKKNDAKFTLLHDAVQRDIDVARANGKEPTAKDVQEMVNDQVKKSYHRTFRRNQAVFEKLGDVDKDFKSDIQKRKPNITDDEMVEAWDAYQSKDRDALRKILNGK